MTEPHFENGRAFVAGLDDPLDFLAQQATYIETEPELDGMHFLAFRPWLETREHFGRYLDVSSQMSSMTEPSVLQFAEHMLDVMGVSPSFVLLSELCPLPVCLAKASPAAYAAFRATYSAQLYDNPSMSIGDVVGASSTAAVKAIFDLGAHGLTVDRTSELVVDEVAKARFRVTSAQQAADQFPAGKILLAAFIAAFVVAVMMTPSKATAMFVAVFVLVHLKERALIKDVRHAIEICTEVQRRVLRRTSSNSSL